jgi:aldose 1-epimerase
MAIAEVQIRDEATGARATILTGFGFNCYKYVVPGVNGPSNVLWAIGGFENGDQRPSGSGIPILFPFPGRIGGAAYEWGDKKYRLTDGDGLGNAIHGFVHTRPWRVVRRQSNAVTGEFQASVDAPEVLELWPADFLLQVTYEIGNDVLSCSIHIENPSAEVLPCGLGLHPYFRLPLGDAGAVDDCLVTVPAQDRWELVDLLPTGRSLPLAEAESLVGGKRFGDTQLDDVLANLTSEGGRVAAEIVDAKSNVRRTITFSDDFLNCVVFNPPHREAICVEPYSCVPDFFRLESMGIDAGFWRLGASETIDVNFVIATGPIV